MGPVQEVSLLKHPQSNRAPLRRLPKLQLFREAKRLAIGQQRPSQRLVLNAEFRRQMLQQLNLAALSPQVALRPNFGYLNSVKTSSRAT
jgi:hypothetical protein